MKSSSTKLDESVKITLKIILSHPCPEQRISAKIFFKVKFSFQHRNMYVIYLTTWDHLQNSLDLMLFSISYTFFDHFLAHSSVPESLTM